jgi:hypothetical protein
MSGSLYQYTPYPVAGQPQEAGAAFRSGFVGSQEIERNAQALQEAEQLMKLRQLQSERSAAAEARTAQMFPLQFTASQLAVKQAARTAPFEVERAGLTNKQLEAQIASLRSQIAERTATGQASTRFIDNIPTYTPSGAPAPTTPGVRVPGATPGLLAPEAVIPTAPAAPTTNVPGPQSSAPDWLNQQFGERRFSGVQVASGGVSDSTGLPSGVTPEMINGQPGVVVTAEAPAAPAPRPGPTERLPMVRPLAPASSPRLIDAAVAELSLDPSLRTPAMIQQVAGQYGVDPAIVAERLGVVLPVAPPASPTPQAAATPTGQLPQSTADFGTAGLQYPDFTEEQVARARQEQTPIQAPGQQAPSDIYITEPGRIGQDRRRLTESLADLQNGIRAAAAARDREGALRLTREARSVVDQLRYLDGMTAITRFRTGDAAPLANELYTASENRMQLQPRSDGTFNLYLDGQVANQGVTRQQIEASARSLFDTRYREQMQATQTRNAELAMYQAKQRIEQLTRASADIAVKEVEAALKAREPNLDVRTLTDANGQQSLVITDKRTGAPISSARIIRLPPAPGTTAERFTIEVLPVTR